jgi:hypothetical protein
MTHSDHAHPPPDGSLEPTAYALRGTLTLPGPWSETELRKGVDAFLAELTRSLREQGCRLIGHIKGILDTGDKGHLFFSVTSFEQRTRFKGGLTGEYEKIDLTLNVIVYGVGSGEIEQLVLEGLRKHLGEVAHDNQ